MRLRPLGHSGLTVPPLCLGTNVFGWTADEPTSFRLLDACFEAGLNFLDTADTYSTWVPGHQGGESEVIIGKWFRRTRKRAQVILATKVGKPMGPGKQGLARAYIRQAVEDSMQRLQTDYIDLYQSHTDDLQTPLEETLAAFGELIEQGKVRALGASNYTAPRLREALRVSAERGLPRYESLQPNYNLCDRADYEAELEPLCMEHGLGVISYFSLASGFLAGKYRSEADLAKSARGAFVKKYLDGRCFGVLKAVEEVAKQHASTPAAVSLAWLMARPSITAPIASATNLDQLRELVAATNLGLEPAAIEFLNQASQ